MRARVFASIHALMRIEEGLAPRAGTVATLPVESLPTAENVLRTATARSLISGGDRSAASTR
jgi:hypothetical protein